MLCLSTVAVSRHTGLKKYTYWCTVLHYLDQFKLLEIQIVWPETWVDYSNRLWKRTLDTKKNVLCYKVSMYHMIWLALFESTIKLGFMELLKKGQIGNSEPFSVTNLPVYLINCEQIGISEQFWDDQKVP